MRIFLRYFATKPDAQIENNHVPNAENYFCQTHARQKLSSCEFQSWFYYIW